ncbi:unnamed protein product [Phyllotreta striolata]|uniref:Gamma-interferon-inducible lysosomal thiol reductase n=1 Tax=Phyllotreta striolata TaxID=444603 RepID=A0A9N9XIQ5_PHYSR|nr:unnamed protein product [Phyllotreta striolata]
MNIKITKLLLLIVVIILLYKTLHYLQSNNEEKYLEEPINDKIKLSVYYEALCPDSRFFIAYQLLPTYKNFQEYVNLDLIPYGKAQTIETDGQIEFQCQHDAVECFANKIHSCSIFLISDPLLQLEYISCMIKDNTIPDDAGERCAKEFEDIKYNAISECANGAKGTILLKENGERTHSLKPAVTFIPTIELNGNQNLVSQALILKDLKKALCLTLKNNPSVCT